MLPVPGGCHHTWYDSWEFRSCLHNRIHRPSRNTVPCRSLRPPWYQQSVSYGSSGMVYQSRADRSIYNRLVRALQSRLVQQWPAVCAPCDQAVHRSAFRLACEETLFCAAHGKRYFLGTEGYCCSFRVFLLYLTYRHHLPRVPWYAFFATASSDFVKASSVFRLCISTSFWLMTCWRHYRERTRKMSCFKQPMSSSTQSIKSL